MKQSFLSVLAFCVLLISCNTETVTKTETVTFSLDSAKAAIAASNSNYGSSFVTGDSVSFVSHYTSDACISPSNMPRMCGAQAITAFFNGGYKMGIRDIKLTTEEVMGGKDAVVETGTYEILGEKGVSCNLERRERQMENAQRYLEYRYACSCTCEINLLKHKKNPKQFVPGFSCLSGAKATG